MCGENILKVSKLEMKIKKNIMTQLICRFMHFIQASLLEAFLLLLPSPSSTSTSRAASSSWSGVSEKVVPRKNPRIPFMFYVTYLLMYFYSLGQDKCGLSKMPRKIVFQKDDFCEMHSSFTCQSHNMSLRNHLLLINSYSSSLLAWLNNLESVQSHTSNAEYHLSLEAKKEILMNAQKMIQAMSNLSCKISDDQSLYIF